MGIPLVAVGAGVSGVIKGAEAKRIESHISDRMKKFSSYSNEYLQYITTLGGETAEAARRVLGSRTGSPTSGASSQAPGPTVTERIFGTHTDKTPLILTIGAVVLLVVLLKRK